MATEPFITRQQRRAMERAQEHAEERAAAELLPFIQAGQPAKEPPAEEFAALEAWGAAWAGYLGRSPTAEVALERLKHELPQRLFTYPAIYEAALQFGPAYDVGSPRWYIRLRKSQVERFAHQDALVERWEHTWPAETKSMQLTIESLGLEISRLKLEREAEERRAKGFEVLTIDGVAAWLKVSTKTAYKLVKEPSFPAMRTASWERSIRVLRKDFEAWLDQQAHG